MIYILFGMQIYADLNFRSNSHLHGKKFIKIIEETLTLYINMWGFPRFGNRYIRYMMLYGDITQYSIDSMYAWSEWISLYFFAICIHVIISCKNNDSVSWERKKRILLEG